MISDKGGNVGIRNVLFVMLLFIAGMALVMAAGQADATGIGGG